MKNNKALLFIKNLSYSIAANGITLLISVLVTLLLPKVLGVEAYGYYQLYIFYLTYVPMLTIGWADGVYLRTGGQKYVDLNHALFRTQFTMLVTMECLIYSFLIGGVLIFNRVSEKKIVLVLACIAGVAVCTRLFLTYIFQATGRIKEFSITIIYEKLLYIIGVIIVLFLGYRGFTLILIIDVITKYISLLVGISLGKEVVFGDRCDVEFATNEAKLNISTGSKLILASLSSSLIVGVVKYGIQGHWDISTFSKVSFSFSISNMLMQFISAVAIVLFPMLKNTAQNKLPTLYSMIRSILMTTVFGIFIFYYPCAKILSLWLPDYAESIRYAAILIPICIYESKMSLLINTYYKSLRLEALLMKINVFSLCISCILTIYATIVFNNIIMTVISILVVLAFRGILGEILLSRKINIEIKKDVVLELLMTLSFVLCNWYLGVIGMLVYFITYLLYLFIKRLEIKEVLFFVKEKIKS